MEVQMSSFTSDKPRCAHKCLLSNRVSALSFTLL
jgi:hypothetical protein